MGQQSPQALGPPGVEPPQLAVELAHRLPALSLGLGIDQVRHRFGLGEIEFAVLEGAAGEFAGPGRA